MPRACQAQGQPAARLNRRFVLSPIDALIDLVVRCGLPCPITEFGNYRTQFEAPSNCVIKPRNSASQHPLTQDDPTSQLLRISSLPVLLPEGAQRTGVASRQEKRHMHQDQRREWTSSWSLPNKARLLLHISERR